MEQRLRTRVGYLRRVSRLIMDFLAKVVTSVDANLFRKQLRLAG